MKKIITTFIILYSISTFSQDFEGEITYDISYFSRENTIEITSAELISQLGNRSTFITKEGKSKQLTNSVFMAFIYFNPDENKIYYKDRIESDTLFFEKGNRYPNTEFTYEIIKNADTILGHICDKLIYKDQNLEQHLYFASELKVDPKYFDNFTSFNKNKQTDLMKSIYLRLDSFFPNFIIKTIATDIKKRKINNSEFDLPEYKIITEK